MAQKRMIDKKISVSEQISELPIEAQLIFTWAIPHSDDIGLLPHSVKSLKALVVPMQDWNIQQFTDFWNMIVASGLVVEFVHEEIKYWRIAKFFKFQTLRKDVQPYTMLQVKMCAKPRDSWSILYLILEAAGVRIDTERADDVTEPSRDVNVPGTEEKRREEKRSKEKRIIYTSKFEEFWVAYPKKVGKMKTFELWSVLSQETQSAILLDVPARKLDRKWVNGKYVKDPERYIKNRQWEDDIIPEEEPKVEQSNKPTHKI